MSIHHRKNNKDQIIIFVICMILLGISIYGFFYKRIVSSIQSHKVPTVSTEVGNTPAEVGTDLLGKAEISFAGGTSGRGKNIELGVARINGKTILPGEEFSFTKAIGSVTEEDGYSKEKIFLNGEVTKGVGGGLCQVSSTLFQTILHAGFPVTERHNHSYSVSYYDVGLDATYSDPGPDLRFKNDTENPIVIRGKTENQKVVFEIYGTRDGRVASTTDAEITSIVDFPPTKYIATTTRDKNLPECINKPQIGYTAKVVYNILYASGQTQEHIFTSTYKPLQRVCYISM